jgi:hypothetical protein
MFILVTMLILVSQAALFADDLDPGDDYTASAGGQGVTWEPMIVHFSAASSHGSSSLVAAPTSRPALGEDVIGEANQWLGIKPLIQSHNGAYNRGEAVISAWERVLNGDTPRYVLHDSGLADGENLGKIHSIYADDFTIGLSADFDILMNATPAKKDEIVKESFKIVGLDLVVFQVTKDYKDFRAALTDSAPKFVVHKIGDFVPEEAKSFPKIAHNYARRTGFVWAMNNDQMARQPGVYEFQLTLTVEGKMPTDAKPTRKSFTGAIRVAVVDNSKLQIDILDKDSQRKPGQEDIIKGGRVVGTKDKK